MAKSDLALTVDATAVLVGLFLMFSVNPVLGLAWKPGDAEALPFPDNSFDAYTIAFGIRNCTHIDKVTVITAIDVALIVP